MENKRPARHAIYRPLLSWYDKFGRHDLPWKQHKTPYAIWLSEIMLQQTQVATVIPYFYRFIAAFPSMESLAKAELNQVLALWSGLGYYARARNLHKAAQAIFLEFSGMFPETLEALVCLPGIGRSTAGAILAQSFNAFGVILDGNVKRVLTRYLCLKPDVQIKQSAKQFESQLWAYAEHFTPKLSLLHRIGDYTQAIMDLGATICTRTQPKCTQCPLQKTCQAQLTQTQAHYPVKPLKKIKPSRETQFLVLCSEPNPSALPQILLSQRPSKGIWGGLWSFPELSMENPLEQALEALGVSKKCLAKASQQTLGKYTHIFTHFKLEYEAHVITLKTKPAHCLASQKTKWYNALELSQIGLPSPVTKILNQVGFLRS